MQLMSSDREYFIVRIAQLEALPTGDFYREAENIHNQWFAVLCPELVQYYDNRAKQALTACKGCK
jgi:hypothetical protein